MNVISITGLAPEHQARIREIGLWAWMDEQSSECSTSETTPSELTSPKSKPARTRRPCAVCGKTFLAKRADARLCSVKCRHRASRYGSGTDNAKTTSVVN